MKAQLTRILNESFEALELQDSTLICRIYSKVYKNGQIVKNCISSRKNYYREIQLTGHNKLKEMDEKKTYEVVEGRKTAGTSGLTRINDVQTPHVHLDNLSDERTIELLKKGTIKKEWYVKLPEGFKEDDSEVTKKQADKKAKK